MHKIVVATLDDLSSLRPQELERHANVLLYGDPDILDESMERQIFHRRIYVPRDMGHGIVYRPPKYTRERLRCGRCARPRSDMSASLCSFCYRLKARLRYFDLRDGLSYWESQMEGGWEHGLRVGVTMPVTEWWDNRDIPAHPNRRLAYVDWA